MSSLTAGTVRPHLSLVSEDASHVLAVQGHHIAVFSVISGRPIRHLSLDAINIPSIVDIIASPAVSSLAYVLTIDSLHIVNWLENVSNPIIASFKLNDSYTYKRFIKFHSNSSTKVYLLASSINNEQQNSIFNVLSYDLESNTILETISSFTNISSFSISTNGIIFVSKRPNSSSLITINYISLDSFESYTFTHSLLHSKANITTCAVSNNSDDPIIALAYSTGLIVTLFDIFSSSINSIQPPTKSLKWHMDPVTALSFNHDSTYLFSGGSEKVLVLWNIINDKQSYLPRLNGTIQHISINSNNVNLINLGLSVIDNDMEYLLLNSVDLLSKLQITSPHFFSGLNNNNNLIKKSFQKDINSCIKNLKGKYKYKFNFKSDYKFNPISKNLYLSAGRFLQIYDPIHDLQLSNIAVIPPSQQYGKVGNEHNLSDPLLVGFDFISSSKSDINWLVTCDVQINGEKNLSSVVQSLKFWKFNSSTNKSTSSIDNYTLNYHIVDPMISKISCILPAPESYFKGEALITADILGNVKLWRPNNSGVWTLRKYYKSGIENDVKKIDDNVNNYNIENLNNNNSTKCAWSPDNNIIAVARNGKIIFLDINTFTPIEFVKPAISSSKFHKHAKIINDDNNDSISENSIRYLDINLQNNQIISIDFSSNGKLLYIQTRTNFIIFHILKNKILLGLTFNNSSLTLGFSHAFTKLIKNSNDNTNIDDNTDTLLIVCKYFNKETSNISSKITTWDITSQSSIKRTTNITYDGLIIGAEWDSTSKGWLFADIDSNFVHLDKLSSSSSTKSTLDEKLELQQTTNTSISTNAGLLANARLHKSKPKPTAILIDDEKSTLYNGIFDTLIDRLDGVSMETLFDNVLHLV